MLQTIHDRTKGWFATFIFALITIPFALWGINHYLDDTGKVNVAEVDGDPIGLGEFQRNYQLYRQQMQMFMGGMDPSKLNEDAMKRQLLNQLIDSKLIVNATDKSGIRVSDNAIVAAIQQMPEFHQDGKFSKDAYTKALQQAGLSPAAFEEQQRRSIQNEQLQRAVAETAFVIPQEVDRIARLKNQKRTFAYATLAAEPLKAETQISDDAAKKYYEDHKTSEFMVPEQVKIAYVEMSVEEQAKKVAVDDKVLKDYYDAHASNYSVAEQRNAAYIVVPVPKDAKPADDEAAKKQAEDFVKQAKAGKALDVIAKEAPATAIKSEAGETGLVSKGALEAAINDKLFALKADEVSDPIKTGFGYQILKVKEIKPGSTKSLADAKVEVEQAYRKEQAEKAFYDQGEQLRNLSFEHPDTLEPVAKALNLEVKESEFFSRQGGKDITAKPKIIDAAFSPEVLEESNNSEPLEVDNEHIVTIRIKERKPAEPKKFEDVKTEIVDKLKLEEVKKKLQERGEKLLAKLKAGDDRAKLAQDEKLEWKDAKEVDQKATDVNQAILRGAFKAGRPVAADKPLYSSIALGTGDVALIAVTGVQDPDPKTIEEKVRNETKERLKSAISSEDWQNFMAALRSQATIKTYTDKL